MDFIRTLRHRFPPHIDWFVLAFLGVAAPLIASAIHSLFIYHDGLRLYNAEIGGTYFRGGGSTGIRDLWVNACGCGTAFIPTFLVLVPVRCRRALFWLVWVSTIIFWTWVCFSMEVALK